MKPLPDATFHRHVRGFLTVYLPRQKGYSAHTIKAYRETLNLWRSFFAQEKQVGFLDLTFDHVNAAVIDEFLGWLETARHCRATTRNHRLAVLKSFFHYAATQDPALVAVYAEAQKIPGTKTVDRPVDYLSETALRAILMQPDGTTDRGARDQVLLILLYDTAARICELLDVRLGDLALQAPVPVVYVTGKGRKMRAIPLLDKTVDHLRYYLERFHPEPIHDRDFLFYTVRHGRRGRMSEDTAAYWVKRYSAMARIECPEVPEAVHPHLFRHTRAMHLYQGGMPLSYIKDFLGHAQLHTTDRYASADTRMLRQALEQIESAEVQDHPVWQDNEALLLKLCGLR